MLSRSKKVVKSLYRNFFNVTAWLGVKHIAQSTRLLNSVARSAFKIPKASKTPQTFAQAVKQYKLTEADIKQRQQSYLMSSLLCVLLAVGLFIYWIYLIYTGGYWLAVIGVFGLVTAFCAMAVYCNFWHFQIKHRKLGCTLREWKSGKINQERSE